MIKVRRNGPATLLISSDHDTNTTELQAPILHRVAEDPDKDVTIWSISRQVHQTIKNQYPQVKSDDVDFLGLSMTYNRDFYDLYLGDTPIIEVGSIYYRSRGILHYVVKIPYIYIANPAQTYPDYERYNLAFDALYNHEQEIILVTELDKLNLSNCMVAWQGEYWHYYPGGLRCPGVLLRNRTATGSNSIAWVDSRGKFGISPKYYVDVYTHRDYPDIWLCNAVLPTGSITGLHIGKAENLEQAQDMCLLALRCLGSDLANVQAIRAAK